MKKKKSLAKSPGKSLADRIQAMPPQLFRTGSLPWYARLERENPRLRRDLDSAVDAYWRGELSRQCPTISHLIRILQVEVPDIKRQAMEAYIKSRRTTK